ncbi:MAG: hypothetical protein IKH27_05500 [Oscillospiraceae bacterium]|nr:hypothetical protein [Oscillospiraceae bacterium]
MKADELYTLLTDLPDDYVTAAAGMHTQSRRPLAMIVPALAACITLLIAAAVYPKLRTQQPERQEPVMTAETTAPQTTVTVTAEAPAEEPPAGTTIRTTAQTAPHTTKKQTAITTAVTPKTETAAVTHAQPETTAAQQQDAPAQEQTEMPAATTVTRRESPTEAPELTQTVTTAENARGENPSGWPEHTVPTIPYRVKQEYAAIPRGSVDLQSGTVFESELPTTTLVMTVPVTQAPTTLPEEPCTQTTADVTMPPPSEEEPRQPSARFDGSYWIINPMKPYSNVTLTGGALKEDGTLYLTLLCLTGDGPPDHTVQLDLTLPPEISEAVTGTDIQLSETDSEAYFAEVKARTPVLYNRMKKEDEP